MSGQNFLTGFYFLFLLDSKGDISNLDLFSNDSLSFNLQFYKYSSYSSPLPYDCYAYEDYINVNPVWEFYDLSSPVVLPLQDITYVSSFINFNNNYHASGINYMLNLNGYSTLLTGKLIKSKWFNLPSLDLLVTYEYDFDENGYVTEMRVFYDGLQGTDRLSEKMNFTYEEY